MAILGGILGDLLDPVKDIISEVVVDKDKKIEIQFKLKELEDKLNERVHEQILAQTEINKTEAEHDSIFVAGWRPFAGWVGGIGLATSTVVLPIAHWLSRVWGYDGPFPIIHTELLIMVLGGMLGLGGFRSWEKINGVARESVNVSGTQPVSNTTVEVTEEGAVSVETAPANPNPSQPPKRKKKKVFGIF